MSEAQLITHAGEGYLILLRDGLSIASNSEYDLEHSSRIVKKIRDAGLTEGRVCHVGAGLSIIPRLLGEHFEHVLLDREPATEQFCPEGSKFLLGEWNETIALGAPYSVIVWDIEGHPPAILASYLTDGGIIVSGD